MEMRKINIDHMQTVQSRIVAVQGVGKQSLQMLSQMIWFVTNTSNHSTDLKQSKFIVDTQISLQN